MEELSEKDIREKLLELFAASRIVFWYDPEEDFKDTVEELVPTDVQVLHLTDRNAFRTKIQLEHEDTTGKYLVYAPFAKPDVKENHLEDTLLYSKEFYADQLSYFMANARIPVRLRPAVEKLRPFLFGPKNHSNKKLRAEAAKRREDFLERARDFDWMTAEDKVMYRVAICTLVEGRNTTVDDLFYGLFAGSEDGMHSRMDAIRRFNLEPVLWDLCRERFGYEEANPTLERFILSLFAVITFRDHLDKLPKKWNLFATAGLKNRVNNCSVLLDNMMNHVLYQERFDSLSQKAAQDLDAVHVLGKLPLALFLSTASFACIDELFIQWVKERLVGLDTQAEMEGLSLEEVCQKRLGLHFGEKFRAEYTMLLAGKKLLELQNYAPRNTLQELTDSYCRNDWKADAEYRHFVTSYDAVEGERAGQFDTLRNMILNLYQNVFLEPLLLHWNEAYREAYQREVVPFQKNFYKDEVAPVKEKVAVLISDAFRLEAARELAEKFRNDENCSVVEKVRMAPLPSVTFLGMAELLPHEKLELARETSPKVFLDGKPCVSTNQREKILQARNPHSAAIDYDSVLALKATELRNFSAGKEVIYIYHNRIDATGEALKTESSVFQAVQQTIEELFRLVKRLSRTGNIYRFLVTADHGFLYTRGKLQEADKLEVGDAGSIWMKDRRFLLTDRPVEREGVYSVPLGKVLDNQDDRYVVLAKGMSVFKASGGMNYVHGGSSPQELLVPSLFISTKRGVVDTEDAKPILINDIRKISNYHVKLSFYQDQPVSDVVKAAAYKIHFETGSGELISNEPLYRAESKGVKQGERVSTLEFDLQKRNYDANQRYYLKIINARTEKEIDSREVLLDLPEMEY